MLLSGGVAGLIWMPALFGDAHSYGTTFQAGLGFTGIAVALLGRNHPVGIAFGALLFAFLTEQSQPADDRRPTSPRHRPDHPGRAGARRRRRLRAGPPLPGPPGAARRWPSSSPTVPHVRGGGRHEHRRPSAPRRPGARCAPRSPALPGRRWAGCSAAFVAGLLRPGRHRRRRARPRPAPSARPSLATCPILLAGLAGLWSERAGVVNIGLEGMMILGTWGAAYFALLLRPVGRASSAPRPSARSAALLHALATVIFGVDHIVSGVAINIIGARRRAVPRRGLLLRPPGRRPDASSTGAGPAARRRRSRRLSDALTNARGQALVPGLRRWPPCVGALTTRGLGADRHRRCCWSSRTSWHPVAHAVRPAAALLRREPGRRRDARRQRLPLQVRRGADLRRARRARRRLPRAGRLQRLHRPARPTAAATSAWPR